MFINSKFFDHDQKNNFQGHLFNIQISIQHNQSPSEIILNSTKLPITQLQFQLVTRYRPSVDQSVARSRDLLFHDLGTRRG
jgi:hypothetical protein